MRRINVEDGDYAVLEQYASAVGVTIARAVVLAVASYVRVQRQMEVVATVPPELYPNPEVSEEEALAIEFRWVHDNGLVSRRRALELLEISRITLERYEQSGLLKGVKVYRGHTYKRQYWYSAENLWDITKMRSRERFISATTSARILMKLQRFAAIQHASQDIAEMRKKGK